MKTCRIFAVLAFVLLAFVPNSRAQAPQDQGTPAASGAAASKPKDNSAASSATDASASPSAIAPITPQAEPDTHSLSGAEMFGLGLGSLQHTHNILDLGLSLNESGGNTGVVNGTGQSTPSSLTMVSETLNLNHIWSHYQLTAFDYGGDSLTYPAPSGQQQNWFQDASIEQTMSFKRLVFRLYDNFIASSGSSFGGQGMGGPGLMGQSSPQVALGTVISGFNPAQTILTGNVLQLNNSALAEADYSISRSSSFTFSGSYNFLHFLSAGYIDNHAWNAQAGYNHSISPKNSIAFTAAYSRFSFVGTGQQIENETFSAVFGRQITNRMAFQISGGPTLLRVYNFVPPSGPRWTWSLNTALKYQWHRAGYSLSYSHGTTPGSGVLLGAESDTLTVSVFGKLAKFWTLNVNAGDGYNTGVSSFLSSGSSASGNFNTWYAGVSLDHQMGRYLDFGLNYGLQNQSENVTTCPVVNCPNIGLTQIGGISLTWHPRPLVID